MVESAVQSGRHATSYAVAVGVWPSGLVMVYLHRLLMPGISANPHRLTRLNQDTMEGPNERSEILDRAQNQVLE